MVAGKARANHRGASERRSMQHFSLIFVSNVGEWSSLQCPPPPSGGFLILPVNVRLFLKHLPWINALPYFGPSLVDKATMPSVTFGVKLFMTLINYAPW